MFVYFNDEWNEEEEVRTGNSDVPRVAGIFKNADTGTEQKEV